MWLSLRQFMLSLPRSRCPLCEEVVQRITPNQHMPWASLIFAISHVSPIHMGTYHWHVLLWNVNALSCNWSATFAYQSLVQYLHVLHVFLGCVHVCAAHCIETLHLCSLFTPCYNWLFQTVPNHRRLWYCGIFTICPLCVCLYEYRRHTYLRYVRTLMNQPHCAYWFVLVCSCRCVNSLMGMQAYLLCSRIAK